MGVVVTGPSRKSWVLLCALSYRDRFQPPVIMTWSKWLQKNDFTRFYESFLNVCTYFNG